MDQPLGYVVVSSEHFVCVLYGLKQSSRAWI
jgi:hypothetical protein